MRRSSGMAVNKSKMKVSITGASGFVGKNLERYLSDLDINVNSISRKDLNNTSWNLIDTDAVVHLAGKAHDLKKTSIPQEYYEVNFELTKKLYDAFLKSDSKKFIFISSVKAAADTVNKVLTEDIIPTPTTHYGKSKLMAEQYIQSQPLPIDKCYYILRPCLIHGPGNKGNLNLLYKFVHKNIPYPFGAFLNKRSFLSIGNLCFVIKGLLEKNVSTGIYNVADDKALSTNEVVSILAASLNRKAKLWAVPKYFIKGLARFGDLLSLPINTERLDKLTENYVVSNDKIKKALSANFPIDTEKGLEITAKSFQ